MKKLIVRFYGDAGVDNPLGYPAEYPSDSTYIDAKDPVPDGWTELSEEAYRKAIDDNVEAVNAKWQAEQDRLALDAANTTTETENQIADLQTHVDSVNQGQATNDDRLVAVDTVAALMLKFAPVLEQLLAMQQDQSKP